MTHYQRLPPSASSLSASMRDIGYSLETAVADIIDNSISAGASTVSVLCDLNPRTPTLAIIDNGIGMNRDGIISAMRHGLAKSQIRSAHDLGRFGLGLKTASFSQCRRLTVVSIRNGQYCGAEWDLDLIDKEDDWILTILDDEDISNLPFIERLTDSGTLVIWRNLDRLSEDMTGRKRDEIVNGKLDLLGKHLSLVFHRFLAGEIRGRRISISINNHPVEPFDPFCRRSGSEILPEEIVRFGTAAVHIQAFILPHHSRLSAGDYDNYQDRSDFISNQGVYIYRNGRLMAWGGWFQLIPRGEATKLARVQVDFPSSLDEMWTIDIKKSRARPPYQVRERLRQIIPLISGRSITVHRGRGQKLFDEATAPVWERYADHGSIHYALNAAHPLIGTVAEDLDENGRKKLHLLLETVAASVPVEMIYADYSTNPKEVRCSQADGERLTEQLKLLKGTLFSDHMADAAAFLDVIRSTRLFEDSMDMVEQFIQKEF